MGVVVEVGLENPVRKAADEEAELTRQIEEAPDLGDVELVEALVQDSCRKGEPSINLTYLVYSPIDYP